MGFRHPDELLGAISARQFDEWKAYHLLEPFGSPADDERAGTVASAALQMAGGKPVPPREFFNREKRLEDLLNIDAPEPGVLDDVSTLAPLAALSHRG